MTAKKSGRGSKGPTDYRDSGTGKFVTPGTAKSNPKGTEGEQNRPPPKKK